MSEKKPYGLEEKELFKFLIKLHERLTIILDDNINKNVDPTESDIILLEKLCEFHERLTYELMETKGNREPLVTQSAMF